MRRLLAILYGNRWLLSRRVVQLLIIAAFAVELPAGGYLAQGNLSSSDWFGLGLTDPFIWLQSMFASASFSGVALTGAVIITLFYVLLGGRIYCSWVCPINLLTDLAYWLRQKLHIKTNFTISKNVRVIILMISLLLSLLSGTLAWEAINPITLFQRELMWGSLVGSMVLASIFLFDVFVTRRGWCGYVCPVGAFYSELGRVGRLRIKATHPGSCNGCRECIRVCPEPHVLAPLVANNVLYVTSGDCTRCGACLDACKTGALRMNLGFKKQNTFQGIDVVTSD